MVGHAPADVDKAVAAGADHAHADPSGPSGSSGSSGPSGGGAGGGRWDDDEGADATASDVARDMLLSLPGVNVHNFRAVMSRVPNLAALAALDVDELAELVGPVNGKKLHEFLRRRG